VKLKQRETVLLVVTALAALYGVTSLLAGQYIDKWQRLHATELQLSQRIEAQEGLLQQSERWTQELAALEGVLPRFEQGRQAGVFWLNVVQNAADQHKLLLKSIDDGDPKLEGGAYELPIDCRAWEGTLDALIHFLFALQRDGAMIDTQYLRITAKDKNKTLRSGRFTLSCAYIQDEG
jgi:Tfp pilus assembly protein PilN